MSDKDLAYYLKLPYTIVLRRDEEGDVVARIDELPGCSAHAKTAEEAVANLEEAKEAWIEDALQAEHHIPEPAPIGSLPSGKWVQRVSRSLHKKLVQAAKKEGVSLNALVSTILAEAVGFRKASECNVVASQGFTEHDLAAGWLTWYEGAADPFRSSANYVVLEPQLGNVAIANTLSLLSKGFVKNRQSSSLKEIEDAEKTHKRRQTY